MKASSPYVKFSRAFAEPHLRCSPPLRSSFLLISGAPSMLLCRQIRMKASCFAPSALPHLPPKFAIQAIALLAHSGLIVKCPDGLTCKHASRLGAWQCFHTNLNTFFIFIYNIIEWWGGLSMEKLHISNLFKTLFVRSILFDVTISWRWRLIYWSNR